MVISLNKIALLCCHFLAFLHRFIFFFFVFLKIRFYHTVIMLTIPCRKTSRIQQLLKVNGTNARKCTVVFARKEEWMEEAFWKIHFGGWWWWEWLTFCNANRSTTSSLSLFSVASLLLSLQMFRRGGLYFLCPWKSFPMEIFYSVIPLSWAMSRKITLSRSQL